MPTSSDATIAVLFDQGVPEGAPCLDGHFPGNPIVPGAVLLGYGADVLRQEGWEFARISRVKFLHPLQSDTPFRVEVTLTGSSAGIAWRAGDRLIAQAKADLDARRA